jgi:hypothetical protein
MWMIPIFPLQLHVWMENFSFQIVFCSTNFLKKIYKFVNFEWSFDSNNNAYRIFRFCYKISKLKISIIWTFL